jgi:hypothetical protein
MQGLDTEELVVLVDAISEAYQAEMEGIAADSRAGTKRALKQLITKYNVRLQQYRDQHKSLAVPRDEAARRLHREAALEDLREYRRELRKLRLARLAARAELRRAEEREKESPRGAGGKAPEGEAQRAKDREALRSLDAHIVNLQADVDKLTERIVQEENRAARPEVDREDVGHIEAILRDLRAEREKLGLKERMGTGLRLEEKATVRPAEGRLASLARLLGLAP